MYCPKCGAKECFRSSAYAEWQCGSADDFGEFVEEDKCLFNQLAQAKEEITDHENAWNKVALYLGLPADPSAMKVIEEIKKRCQP